MTTSFIKRLRLRGLCSWACVCTIAALAALFTHTAMAATVSERKLKSAFLYNFTKFIEWPAERFGTSTSPLIVALMADAEMAAEMSSVAANRLVNGRPVDVRRVSRADDLRGVHLLYVSAAEHARFMALRESVEFAGVLTVGEDKDCKLQSSICFTQQGEKLRFEINIAAAERSQLKISSQLQKLAVAVHRG